MDANIHPGMKLGRRQQLSGALYVVGGLAMAWAMPFAGAAFVSFGGVYLWLGTSLRRGARDIVPLTGALDLFSRGDLAGAVARAEPLAASKSAGTRRGAIALRGLIALERGDAKEADRELTRALAIRTGRDFADARPQLTAIRAHRALARALDGNETGALEDARLASVPRDCVPTTLAVSALARAIIAAKHDDRRAVLAELAACTRMATVMSAPTRKLVSSLDRFARDTSRSAYRHPAKLDEDVHPIAAWLEKKPARAAPEFPKTPVSPQQKPRTRNVAQATALLWFALMLMFAAIWRVLNARGGTGLYGTLQTFLVVVFGGAIALTAWRMGLGMIARRRRRAITIGALRGEEASLRALEIQAVRGVPDASLTRALLAERAAQFEVALGHCDHGLASSNTSMAAQTTTFDTTAPALAAERAFCLAALGREKDAEAALASITNPNFPGATTTRFRVSLASALVRGDREAALDLAHTYAPSIALPLRDALLVDMLQAKSDYDWTRIHAAIADDPSLAKWTEHFMGAKKNDARVVAPVQVPEEMEEPIDLADEARAVEQ